MTVMLVGLVNSGVMELGQTIGVIMGSNIGTTLTAWLLSLTGIESESFFVNFLKPKNFSPLLALAGILLIMGSKKQRRRDVGRVMMGFSILMYGMELMSGAVAPLADMPEFTDLMTAFTNPLLGVLVGAAFTGISGFSFLVFNLLCAPCFAAIGAIKREMNNRKWTWFAIGYQCGFAYLISLMINQFGGLFTGSVNVIGLIFALAALALMVYMLVRPYKEATKLNATV